eukprot:351983_1
MFLSDYYLYTRGMIPMDYIGYLGLLSQQVEKVDRSSVNHGLFEFSTSKGESLNAMLADIDSRSNGDWDELSRKANLVGLKKMDSITHPKFNPKQIIKEVKRNRVLIWNEEIKQSFQEVENKFSVENKRIINILKTHNWRKYPKYPSSLRILINGASNNIGSTHNPRKKRKLNNLFAQLIGNKTNV